MEIFKVNGSKSRIGRKLSRSWNSSVRVVEHRCEACGVDCGQFQFLMNHYRKKHPQFLEAMAQKKAQEEAA